MPSPPGGARSFHVRSKASLVLLAPSARIKVSILFTQFPTVFCSRALPLCPINSKTPKYSEEDVSKLQLWQLPYSSISRDRSRSDRPENGRPLNGVIENMKIRTLLIKTEFADELRCMVGGKDINSAKSACGSERRQTVSREGDTTDGTLAITTAHAGTLMNLLASGLKVMGGRSRAAGRKKR